MVTILVTGIIIYLIFAVCDAGQTGRALSDAQHDYIYMSRKYLSHVIRDEEPRT